MWRKFWVLSWSDFRRGFKVGWYCWFHYWIWRCSIHELFSRVLLLMDFMDWDSYFVFNPKDLRRRYSKLCWVYNGTVLFLNLEKRCSTSAAAQIQLWVHTVQFFWDFFWISGLLEYWIQLYAQGHCFGCSPMPGMQLNSPCKLASSILL